MRFGFSLATAFLQDLRTVSAFWLKEKSTVRRDGLSSIAPHSKWLCRKSLGIHGPCQLISTRV